MVADEGLAGALEQFRGNPQGACDHLIAAANDKGGPDNITVIVVEVQGSLLGSMFDVFKRKTQPRSHEGHEDH